MFDREMRASDICDVQSEAGVVASLILNPELSFYSEWLTPRHFTEQTNGYMYYALKELALKKIVKVDAYNIISVLKKDKTVWAVVEDMLDAHNINEFINEAPAIARSTPEEYKVIADNVKDAAFRRDAFQKLRKCEQMCIEGNDRELGERIYQEIDSIVMDYESSADLLQYKDIVEDIWEDIKNRQSGEMKSIEFPFPILNEYVVMEPGEIVCFAAPQKTGKSAILLTVCADLLKKGKSVLVIDTEISTRLYTTRLLSHLTGIRFSDLRSGNYSEEDEARIVEQVEWLKTRKFIHIYMPTIDDKEIYLAAKKAKHLIDIDVLIIDYLKANASASNADSAYAVYNSLGKISDAAKSLCGKMQICGVTAAQATSTGKIADSAKIARSMSTIIQLSEKSWDEMVNDGTNASRKLRVQFNRNGAQMSENEWIDMGFDGSTLTYFQSPIQHVVEQPY